MPYENICKIVICKQKISRVAAKMVAEIWIPFPVVITHGSVQYLECSISHLQALIRNVWQIQWSFTNTAYIINTLRPEQNGCTLADHIFKCNFWNENFVGFHLEKKSTILLAFFPYLEQIIISIRGCVACNDLWPWPIFSRSFGLYLENCVCSVASTDLDGFFPFLVQMISSMRMCVACDVLWPWPISSRSFNLDFENRVCSVTFSVLDWLFPYLPQVVSTIRGCVAGAGGILDLNRMAVL